MEYKEGYTNLLTYKQGLEIYQKTKRFTAKRLDRIRDSRLIGHMNDSARSVPSNICEGAKRGNTKAYLEFLGFARGSLEELKRDYEELKRELKVGERWADKRSIGINKDKEGLIGINKDKDGLIGIDKDGKGSHPYSSVSIPVNPSYSLSAIEKEIEDLLTLVYGEDCMMGRQIRALGKKAIENKDLPQGVMIKRIWKSAKSADDRFWSLAKDRFGIEKDEKGIIRKKKEK